MDEYDFDNIAERQEWDPYSIIQVLRDFISSEGAGARLDEFARRIANYENEVG